MCEHPLTPVYGVLYQQPLPADYEPREVFAVLGDFYWWGESSLWVSWSVSSPYKATHLGCVKCCAIYRCSADAAIHAMTLEVLGV